MTTQRSAIDDLSLGVSAACPDPRRDFDQLNKHRTATKPINESLLSGALEVDDNAPASEKKDSSEDLKGHEAEVLSESAASM